MKVHTVLTVKADSVGYIIEHPKGLTKRQINYRQH